MRHIHERARRVAAGAPRFLAAVALVWAAVPGVGAVAAPTGLPPVQVPGVRVVDVRDDNGNVSRLTTIPSSSAFRQYGGSRAVCSFVAAASGTTSDGQHFERGQTVQSMRWIFLEGLPVSFGESTPKDPTASFGALADAVRWFTVFCDSTNHALGVVAVSSRDPLLDPRRQAVALRNRLRLVRPVVYRNPVVDRWGGLITRYQAWLAITPGAWAAQRSNTVVWRGWTLSLLAQPVALDFQVDFTPARDRPSTPFHGRVACITRGARAAGDARSLPAMPTLPAQSSPGVNGSCRWTPPGPGTVTFQARVTYRLTFWASGYTETLPDYVWTSLPVTFRTGELAAVNTNS